MYFSSLGGEPLGESIILCILVYYCGAESIVLCILVYRCGEPITLCILVYRGGESYYIVYYI